MLRIRDVYPGSEFFHPGSRAKKPRRCTLSPPSFASSTPPAAVTSPTVHTGWYRIRRPAATKLLLDLARLHRFIESRISSFPNCEVIPAGDLLAAKNGATTSEVLAAYASWGAVHGNSAAYTRMALTLVDKVLSGNFKNTQQQQPVSGGSGKRKRTESSSSSSSSRSSGDAQLRHSRDGQPPGFDRGGSRGGGRGGFPTHSGKRGGNYSGPRDTRYDKYSSHGGRSGSGSGGGYGDRSGYGSGGGGGYNSRF